LASGWHPRDSQLALSTKFVPLLAGLLEDGAGEAGGKASLYVGEPASLPPATAGAPEVSSAASTVSPESGASPPSRPEGTATPEIPTASRSSAPARRIRTPDGSEVVLAAAAEVFEETGEPGIYELLADGEPIRFAVNIAPSERRTAPMAAEDLERLGARLGARAEEARRQRQMLDRELESRQKGWRWLIAGVLGILILETWLAGRRARSAWKSEIPT
ncbi:MAG: hypothetical protein JXA90_06115, partial [Planctomycetes bacterium]|nr:hypothetical protein [Planctomycetota bacterium]